MQNRCSSLKIPLCAFLCAIAGSGQAPLGAESMYFPVDTSSRWKYRVTDSILFPDTVGTEYFEYVRFASILGDSLVERIVEVREDGKDPVTYSDTCQMYQGFSCTHNPIPNPELKNYGHPLFTALNEDLSWPFGTGRVLRNVNAMKLRGENGEKLAYRVRIFQSGVGLASDYEHYRTIRFSNDMDTTRKNYDSLHRNSSLVEFNGEPYTIPEYIDSNTALNPNKSRKSGAVPWLKSGNGRILWNGILFNYAGRKFVESR